MYIVKQICFVILRCVTAAAAAAAAAAAVIGGLGISFSVFCCVCFFAVCCLLFLSLSFL